MRTSRFTSLSERDWAAIRLRRAWEREEEAKQREMEDKQGYEAYLQTLAQEQARTPKAYQIAPLSFEEWRKNLPAEEADPTVRALVGTKNALTKAHVASYRQKFVNKSFSDDDLTELGFDLRVRPVDNSEIDLVHLRQCYDSFRSLYAHAAQPGDPEYLHELHFNELSDFINTYNIDPNLHNLESAFAVLWHLHVIEPKPEPEPELNQYGVNLNVERDPEQERQQKRHDYYNRIVVIDPRDGRTYTDYQLDQLSADEYKRLTMGEHFIPTIRTVVKPNVK